MTTRGKKNERGATTTEYGLIVAGIVAAIIIPIQAVHFGFDTTYTNAATPECGTVSDDPTDSIPCHN